MKNWRNKLSRKTFRQIKLSLLLKAGVAKSLLRVGIRRHMGYNKKNSIQNKHVDTS